MIETYRGIVQPWLTDKMGHLTAFRYVEMFDTSFYHLLAALGESDNGHNELGWADVTHAIEYREEARIGDLLVIRSGVLATGRSSVTARHVMGDPAQTRIHAVMDVKTVRFDLRARRSVPLPSGFAARAAALPPAES